MANSVSDARSSEQDIRQQLIQAHAVDVMVAVGPNMFYTVTLPCTLWFFDPGKAKSARAGTMLFIDARHTYRQVDRPHREWTPADRISGEHRQALPWRAPGLHAWRPRCRGEKPKFADVPGLCRAATLKEIEAQGWSLNPGRYVGVAPGAAGARWGASIHRRTMRDWVEIASLWLGPIHRHMHRALLAGNYIQANERPIRYNAPDHVLGKSLQCISG